MFFGPPALICSTTRGRFPDPGERAFRKSPAAHFQGRVLHFPPFILKWWGKEASSPFPPSGFFVPEPFPFLVFPLRNLSYSRSFRLSFPIFLFKSRVPSFQFFNLFSLFSNILSLFRFLFKILS
jgi:hypothetical protein